MLSWKYIDFSAEQNMGYRIYSLKRCSKLPTVEGIEPVILLQDKSLKGIFM